MLGVPVGWEFYPFCRSANDLKVADLNSDDKTQEFTPRDARCKPVVLEAFEVARNAEKNTILVTFSSLIQVARSCTKSETEGSALCLPKLSYPMALLSWLKLRWSNDFSSWILGVLVGGALIGLGGPFWYDLFKRLSAVAQITRAAGFATRTKSKPADGPESDPETAHAAKDVYDAFTTAQKVRLQMNQTQDDAQSFITYAALSEGPEESESDEVPVTVTPPRVALGPDGSKL